MISIFQHKGSLCVTETNRASRHRRHTYEFADHLPPPRIWVLSMVCRFQIIAWVSAKNDNQWLLFAELLARFRAKEMRGCLAPRVGWRFAFQRWGWHLWLFGAAGASFSCDGTITSLPLFLSPAMLCIYYLHDARLADRKWRICWQCIATTTELASIQTARKDSP